MKCNTVEKLLPEYVEDALSPKHRILVSSHLASCDHCRESEQILREQLLTLGRSFKAAAGSCPDFPDLSRKVLASLQEPSDDAYHYPVPLRLLLRPSFSFAALAAIAAAVCFLFFQGLLSSAIVGAPELRTGRQQAFTAQPRIDGRVDSGIVQRRYARIQTVESGWPR